VTLTPVPPRESIFEKIEDFVSEKMGKPTNIIFWLIFVLGWTCLFAFGGPHLDTGTWLPSWFTSQGFNFPLNLITTVAELFIGFLVAGNALRIQKLSDAQTQRIIQVETTLLAEQQDNTDLTRKVHELTTTIAAQTATLDEIHRHVSAMSPESGTFPPPAAER
jgi:hypothetical protein